MSIFNFLKTSFFWFRLYIQIMHTILCSPVYFFLGHPLPPPSRTSWQEHATLYIIQIHRPHLLSFHNWPSFLDLCNLVGFVLGMSFSCQTLVRWIILKEVLCVMATIRFSSQRGGGKHNMMELFLKGHLYFDEIVCNYTVVCL